MRGLTSSSLRAFMDIRTYDANIAFSIHFLIPLVDDPERRMLIKIITEHIPFNAALESALVVK